MLMAREITHWKLQYEQIPADKAQPQPAAAIKDCDPVHFPISRTLPSASMYTLPITSCECECRASTLRCLNTYMRASGIFGTPTHSL